MSEAEQGGSGSGDEVLADLFDLLQQRCPQPIAYPAYQRRGVKAGDVAEFWPLQALLTASLRHLALVALAEYFATADRSDDINARISAVLLKGGTATGGEWGQLATAVLSHLGRDHAWFVADLASQCRTTDSLPKACAAAQAKRNVYFKKRGGRKPTKAQVRDMRGVVGHLVSSMRWLQDFDLVSPTGDGRTEEGNSEYEVLRYRGHHLNADRRQLPLRLSPDTDRVHLHRSGSGMLSMHPLLVVGDCDDEDCEDEHLFSLVGAKAGRTGRWTAKYVAPTGETFSDRKAGAWLQDLLSGKRRLQRIAGGVQRSHEATDPNRLPDGRVLDRRWRIDGFLGSGGMGYVYETQHVVHQERVGALKTLPRLRRGDEGLRRRFEDEVWHLQNCRHPGVVEVLARGTDRTVPFFVMELATGWRAEDGTLQRTLADVPRPLARPLFLDVAKQVVDALGEVHRNSLVHRDIKPSNLLLFDGGVVKLGDFGVIRDEEATGYSASGVVVGTPLYASPEQIDRQPDQPLGPRSDVFSLGVALYQLLTDRLPFPALGLVEQITQKLLCKPSVLRADDEWQGIVFPAVMRCLRKDPDDRFESVAALYAALAEALPEVEVEVEAEAEAPLPTPSATDPKLLASATRKAFRLARRLAVEVPPLRARVESVRGEGEGEALSAALAAFDVAAAALEPVEETLIEGVGEGDWAHALEEAARLLGELPGLVEAVEGASIEQRRLALLEGRRALLRLLVAATTSARALSQRSVLQDRLRRLSGGLSQIRELSDGMAPPAPFEAALAAASAHLLSLLDDASRAAREGSTDWMVRSAEQEERVLDAIDCDSLADLEGQFGALCEQAAGLWADWQATQLDVLDRAIAERRIKLVALVPGGRKRGDAARKTAVQERVDAVLALYQQLRTALVQTDGPGPEWADRVADQRRWVLGQRGLDQALRAGVELEATLEAEAEQARLKREAALTKAREAAKAKKDAEAKARRAKLDADRQRASERVKEAVEEASASAAKVAKAEVAAKREARRRKQAVARLEKEFLRSGRTAHGLGQALQGLHLPPASQETREELVAGVAGLLKRCGQARAHWEAEQEVDSPRPVLTDSAAIESFSADLAACRKQLERSVLVHFMDVQAHAGRQCRDLDDRLGQLNQRLAAARSNRGKSDNVAEGLRLQGLGEWLSIASVSLERARVQVTQPSKDENITFFAARLQSVQRALAHAIPRLNDAHAELKKIEESRSKAASPTPPPTRISDAPTWPGAAQPRPSSPSAAGATPSDTWHLRVGKTSIPFLAGEPITIGVHRDCDVCIEGDPSLSMVAARIEWKGPTPRLVRENTDILFEGERYGSKLLKHGDRFQLGWTHFEITDGRAPPPKKRKR
jgi:tRNA A-37 threonylcarbamoyl transferase component Bud32